MKKISKPPRARTPAVPKVGPDVYKRTNVSTDIARLCNQIDGLESRLSEINKVVESYYKALGEEYQKRSKLEERLKALNMIRISIKANLPDAQERLAILNNEEISKTIKDIEEATEKIRKCITVARDVFVKKLELEAEIREKKEILNTLIVTKKYLEK